MRVDLLECTPHMEHLIARAAAQCYSEGFSGNNYSVTDFDADSKLINKVVWDLNHTSILEHGSFTFAIEGISRACSHQLVRFRIASFSQQSQRYVKSSENFEYITPPSITDIPYAEALFEEAIFKIGKCYDDLLSLGIPPEDARFILPNAAETKIFVTMNCRELLHAFSLRCCQHAQWEIRDLFNTMLIKCKEKAPIVFKRAGANCVRGFCTEGSRSCKPELVKKYSAT